MRSSSKPACPMRRTTASPPRAPEVREEAYGEAAAGPDVVAEAPAFAAARPEVEAPHLKHHARAPPPVSPHRTTMTYPYRSLDVFRGEAVLVDDDDDRCYVGDCPKPFYYATADLPPPEVFVAPDAVLSPVRPPPPSPERPRGDPWLALAATASTTRGEGVVFEPVPDPAAPPPPPPMSPPRAVVRQKQPGSRLLPRGHTFITAELRGDGRAQRRPPQKRCEPRIGRSAPRRRRRASRAWVRRRRRSWRRSARSRGPSGRARAAAAAAVPREGGGDCAAAFERCGRPTGARRSRICACRAAAGRAGSEARDLRRVRTPASPGARLPLLLQTSAVFCFYRALTCLPLLLRRRRGPCGSSMRLCFASGGTRGRRRRRERRPELGPSRAGASFLKRAPHRKQILAAERCQFMRSQRGELFKASVSVVYRYRSCAVWRRFLTCGDAHRFLWFRQSIVATCLKPASERAVSRDTPSPDRTSIPNSAATDHTPPPPKEKTQWSRARPPRRSRTARSTRRTSCFPV